MNKDDMKVFYGHKFLVPVEVLPKDCKLTSHPVYKVTGKFVEDGKFFEIESWKKL